MKQACGRIYNISRINGGGPITNIQIEVLKRRSNEKKKKKSEGIGRSKISQK